MNSASPRLRGCFPMLKLLAVVALAIAFLVGAATGDLLAAGTETGTTSVSMSIEGSHLEIELTTDPETLLARLDRLAGYGRPASLPNEPPESPNQLLADAIVRRQAELLRHVIVQFDDRVGQLRVETVTAATMHAADESASPLVKVRLSAAVPEEAGAVRWTYALASAAYPLTVRQGASVTSETIAGADPSIPVALLDRQRPDATGSFWALFVPALFVALITLRVRERRPRPERSTRNA